MSGADPLSPRWRAVVENASRQCDIVMRQRFPDWGQKPGPRAPLLSPEEELLTKLWAAGIPSATIGSVIGETESRVAHIVSRLRDRGVFLAPRSMGWRPKADWRLKLDRIVNPTIK